MITKDNLPELLQSLGFKRKGKVLSKRIGLAEIKVDLAKYSLADLKQIPSVDQQRKYHQFATILRQYNDVGRVLHGKRDVPAWMGESE